MISYNSDIVSTSRETLEKFISNSFENCICIIYVKTTTITYGSILMMKVRKVKKDPNDLSLSIPSAILPGLRVSSSIEPRVNKYLPNCGKLVKSSYTKVA